MKLEIEKPDLVVIEGNKIRVEHARKIIADGFELEETCECEDDYEQEAETGEKEPEVSEETSDSEGKEPTEEAEESEMSNASKDYTPLNMKLGKKFPGHDSYPLIGSIKANKKDLVFPAKERDIITIKEDLGVQGRVIVDFTHKFDKGFIFGRGGKFGCGLGIGEGTTGCAPIDPDGASVRFMWRGIKEGGNYVLDEYRAWAHAMLYIYHQDRIERCGDNFYFGKIMVGKEHRFTLQVQVQPDDKGICEIDLWFDQKHVLNLFLPLTDTDKILDCFLYWQAFRGGAANDPTWYPNVTNTAKISEVNAYSS